VKPRIKPTFWAIAVALLIVAALPHFWKLGSAPEGFYLDEASIAYNAYCIDRTGADEYGTRWPIFFRCFDTYTDPVDVYSAVLPIHFFGLEQGPARLPSALFYTMTCVAFFLLLRQWRLGDWFALGGGLALWLVPWVFPAGRNGAFAGHTAALFGLVMGLLLTDSALRRRSIPRGVLAGAAWAFTFYAHQSARPVVALLAIISGVIFYRLLLRRWQVVVAMAASAMVLLLPMLISVLRFPEAMTARYQQVGISQEAPSLGTAALETATHYAEYFSPRFLLISGDEQLRHHTGFGGELPRYFVPLILAGLWAVIRSWRRQPRYRLVVVGLLVSPVSAALTIDRMHSTRCIYGVVFWLLVAMIGARWLWQQRGVWRTVLLLTVCGGLVESALYLHDYFGAYQTLSRDEFMTDEIRAFKYCFQHLGSNEVLYVSGWMFSPNRCDLNMQLKPFYYVYPLFYGKVDPREYQRGGFPTDSIRLYEDSATRPGLIVLCNYIYVWQQTGPPRVFMNNEPLPPNASLDAVIPAQSSKMKIKLQYEIYRVP